MNGRRTSRRDVPTERKRPTGSLLRHKFGSEFEAEVVAGVAEADVSHHRADQLVIGRNFAAGHIAAEEIAERATEIFVAGIAHEAPRIRDHANEAREQADVRKRVDLILVV